MDSQRYLDRWKIVDTLATLESHETLPALAQVAEQPVQEETLQHDHQFSQQAEEQMIRTSAIQGLEQLARRGVVEAEAEILELTASTDPIVRETAVLAYRRSGPGERAERIAVLEERLPEEHHPLLRIQEVSAVELVPQPEPGSEAPAPTGEGEAGETNAPGEPPAGTSSEAPSEDGGSPPPRAD